MIHDTKAYLNINQNIYIYGSMASLNKTSTDRGSKTEQLSS